MVALGSGVGLTVAVGSVVVVGATAGGVVEVKFTLGGTVAVGDGSGVALAQAAKISKTRPQEIPRKRLTGPVHVTSTNTYVSATGL
jgi:hypothetical protein